MSVLCVNLTSLFDLAFRSLYFLLLYAWSIWIEATKLLIPFPGQDTISASFILGCGHLIFLNR